jgi:hypothetical protein
MSAYVNHLVDVSQPDDIPWTEAWLATNPVDHESRELIEREIPHIHIDPDAVLGTEVFAACDAEFRPLNLRNPGVGKAPAGSYIHGTLDLIVSSGGGEVLLIDDYKTGWSGKVDFYESIHYPTLAFARYPRATRIRFRWMFTRAGAPVENWYDRSDLPRMQSIIRAKVAERDTAVARHAVGETPDVNPFAGLCGYCGLTCRLRAAAEAGEAICAPLQTPEDARSAAGRILALRPVLSHLEESLRSYLTTVGPLDGIASVNLSAATEVPLAAGLEAMGYKVDATDARWDVPLDSLRIGVSDLKRYAKAKSRSGMAEAIDAVSIKKPKETMTINGTMG